MGLMLIPGGGEDNGNHAAVGRLTALSARVECDSDNKRPAAEFFSFEVNQTPITVIFGVSFRDFSFPTRGAATMP